MELSERFIQTLEKEGYNTVYEWQDAPGTIHAEHVHEVKTTIYVTDGSITFDLGGKIKLIEAGQRIDIPANVPHSVTISETGAIYIVGEMDR